jgi:hypothetical protein
VDHGDPRLTDAIKDTVGGKAKNNNKRFDVVIVTEISQW